MDDQSYEIIGVMAPQFEFPLRVQLGMPLAWTDKERAVRGVHDYLVMARLKSGVDKEKAQSDTDAISDKLAHAYPTEDAGWGAVVMPLRDSLFGSVRSALLVLLGAVAFVLLIACTNVANLTLARALARRKEIAIRSALGASRGRVMRQVLTETVLLSVAGGALALLLAHFAVDSIAAFIGPRVRFSVEIGLDGWVLGFTLAISIQPDHLWIGAVMACGQGKFECFAEARFGQNGFRLRGRQGAKRVCGRRSRAVAFAVGRSGTDDSTRYLLQSVNPGIDPHDVLTVPLAISDAKYSTAEQQTNFFNNVLERVRALPGVESAGAVSSLPFQGGSTEPVIAEGQPVVPMADQPEVAVRLMSPGIPQRHANPARAGP